MLWHQGSKVGTESYLVAFLLSSIIVCIVSGVKPRVSGTHLWTNTTANMQHMPKIARVEANLHNNNARVVFTNNVFGATCNVPTYPAESNNTGKTQHTYHSRQQTGKRQTDWSADKIEQLTTAPSVKKTICEMDTAKPRSRRGNLHNNYCQIIGYNQSCFAKGTTTVGVKYYSHV